MSDPIIQLLEARTQRAKIRALATDRAKHHGTKDGYLRHVVGFLTFCSTEQEMDKKIDELYTQPATRKFFW